MELNNMSEAQYMYEQEYLLFVDDYEYELYIMDEIRNDRERRVNNLIGKYLVACDGKSSGKQTYLQDRTVSKGGYWTQYLSNAVGFMTKEEAMKNAKSFKYGNPRVFMLDANKSLVRVY